MIKIWEKYLRVRLIGVRDNFFGRGGEYDQYLAMLKEVGVSYDKSFKADELDEPTIECIAQHLEVQSQFDLKRTIPIRTAGSKVPLYCIHSAYFFETVYDDLARNLSDDQPVYGILSISPELLRTELPDNIYQLAELCVNEIRKIQPDGPYFILGWSISNIIAYEVIQQLNHQNCVAALCMIGPPVFSSKNHSFKTPIDAKIKYLMKKFLSPIESFNKLIKRIEAKKIKIKVSKDQDEGEMEEVFKNTRLLQGLLESYTFEKSSIKAVLVSSPSDQFRYPVYDWSSLLGNVVEEVVIDARHASMLHEPFISDVAYTIQKNLDNLKLSYAETESI